MRNCTAEIEPGVFVRQSVTMYLRRTPIFELIRDWVDVDPQGRVCMSDDTALVEKTIPSGVKGLSDLVDQYNGGKRYT